MNKDTKGKYMAYGFMGLWFIMLIGAIGFELHRNAVIFPITAPSNMHELSSWSERDLMRLLNSYNCSDTPTRHRAPPDLMELSMFCETVRSYWSDAYRESKYEDAREGAERFRNK